MSERRTRPPRHGVIASRALDADAGRDGRASAGPATPLGDVLPGDLLEGRHLDALDLVDRDLVGLVLDTCRIGVLRADDADLGMLRVHDTVIETLDAAVFRVPRSSWRGVVVGRGRIGSAEWYDAELDDVQVRGAKLGYVDLRGSTLRDVTFEDCTIEELDLGGVRADRVAFPGCRIHELSAAGARLQDVDLRETELDVVADAGQLRGATVSELQSALFAAAFARALGVVVD